MAKTECSIFAFEVSVAGTDWHRIINHIGAAKAKYEYWLEVRDCYPDMPITAMRARKLGAPESSEQFIRNAKYRGLPNVRCGDRVRCGDSVGTIVGHNSSANFDVLFDMDAPKYAGLKLNVHPQECALLEGTGDAQ